MAKLKTALLIFVMELATGCASVPKSYDWNWVLIWNRALTVSEMERAAALMPQNDYIRYHEQVVRNYVNPNLGSNPVTDVEREMVYFRLAAQYLFDWQRTGENADKARVYARKLLELPGLHAWSKFLIARVQELDGGSYNGFYVPVPRGEKMWLFSVGQASNRPQEVNFGNLQNDYERVLHEKQGGILGKGTQIVCGAVFLCYGALQSDDAVAIQDLRLNVYLDVLDHEGHAVQIGVSSWTVSQSKMSSRTQE